MGTVISERGESDTGTTIVSRAHYLSGPWILTATSDDYGPDPTGEHDDRRNSRHKPFYHSLPKRTRNKRR